MTMISRENFDFAFSPAACRHCPGTCCIGESGYIWVSAEEIANIAALLGLELRAFAGIYLRRVGGRLSLRERQRSNSFDCIFFEPEQRRCAIYQVRPQQCRTYPFWECYKAGSQKTPAECPGIVRL